MEMAARPVIPLRGCGAGVIGYEEGTVFLGKVSKAIL